MPAKERRVDRAVRIARTDLLRLGGEFRTARAGAGLSLRVVGRAVGRSASQISRVERGLAPSTSVGLLARIGAVLGLDVRIRAYPGSDPLRDAGHVRVIERLRARLGPGVKLRLEVPLPIAGDLRAWDACLSGLHGRDHQRDLPAEVETRIADAQAQIRRLTLKMRDAGVDHVLLVVADTPMNRRAVAAAGTAVSAMFPVSGRRALAALAAGRYPGGSSLIFV